MVTVLTTWINAKFTRNHIYIFLFSAPPPSRWFWSELQSISHETSAVQMSAFRPVLWSQSFELKLNSNGSLQRSRPTYSRSTQRRPCCQPPVGTWMRVQLTKLANVTAQTSTPTVSVGPHARGGNVQVSTYIWSQSYKK